MPRKTIADQKKAAEQELARVAEMEQKKARALERLKAGERLQGVSYRAGYRFESEYQDYKAEGYSYELVRELIRERVAERLGPGDIVVFTTPEAVEAKEAAHKAERDARRRARLDRWADAVRKCFHSDTAISADLGKLDAVLKEIADEAGSLGSLSD